MIDVAFVLDQLDGRIPFIASGVLAAVFLAASGVHSKRLTLSIPALQLIGPLLLLNATFVTPLVPLSTFVMTPAVLGLLAIESLLMVTSSLAVWRLYDAGTAGATLLAQSITPMFAVLLTMLLLPDLFSAWTALASTVVIAAVIAPLRGAFGVLSGRSTVLLLLIAAATGGSLAVTTRLLGDLGLGVAANFMLRNVAAGLLALMIVPPVALRRAHLPALLRRTAYTVPYWVLLLTAVRLGSPVVAQTLLATAPLMVLRYESWRDGVPMPRSLAITSLVVIAALPVLVLS